MDEVILYLSHSGIGLWKKINNNIFRFTVIKVYFSFEMVLIRVPEEQEPV